MLALSLADDDQEVASQNNTQDQTYGTMRYRQTSDLLYKLARSVSSVSTLSCIRVLNYTQQVFDRNPLRHGWLPSCNICLLHGDEMAHISATDTTNSPSVLLASDDQR
jgi:hypothetical protein